MSGIIGQDPTGRSGIVNQFSTLGVGKSPLATRSSDSLLQIGGTSTLRSQTAVGASKSLSLGQNAYLAPDDSWDYISGSADEATLYAQQSGTHVWYVAGSGTGNISFTTAQTIRNSGDVKIDTGDLIIGTTGKGIDFEDTGGTNRVLDDYEEGVCTLAMAAGTSGTIDLNGSLETGSYIKIGNLVTVQGEVYVASVSSPVGHLTLTGLPFTCASGSEREMRAVPSVRPEALTADINAVVGMIVDGATSLNLYRFDGATCQADLAGNIQGGTALTFSITYRTT